MKIENFVPVMTTNKWIWFLAISFLAIAVENAFAEPPKGYLRSICEYRRGSLIQPVTEYRRRLYALREQMLIRASLQGPEIHGYILPSYDDHLNVEVAPHDERLRYLTGFSGVKAVAVITQKKAAIWVEPRYVVQADVELDCDWEIFLSNETVLIADWISTHLYPDQRIGADPHIIPHFQWLQWEKELSDKFYYLERINNNLIDLIWDTNRPPYNDVTIKTQTAEFAGEKWQDKVTELRRRLKYFKCDAMIVTSLTEIAYLLNIRGRDLPFTPVVRSYLIVSMKEIFFYVDFHKMEHPIDFHLDTGCFNEKCVKVKDYYQVWNDIRTYAQIWKKVLIPAPCAKDLGASEAVFSSLPSKIIFEHVSPIIFMRAQKNPVEHQGMINAHVKDGAAICEAMSNLEGKFYVEQWTEEKIRFELERSRLSQKDARGLSHRTVVAYGEHASFPYYISSNITDTEVNDQNLLILESGGHYLEGTTTVARTYMFGEPTKEMKQHYTSVLAGLLRLSNLRFPLNVKPSEIDALVRKDVWESMNDYPKATGYGVGSYGAVEEPPIAIVYGNTGPFHFKEGYFISCESGYYKTGDYGIRLKNVLEVVNVDGKFLQFSDVTLVPYEPKLIDGAFLNSKEKRWLNEYNGRIREHVGTELKRLRQMQAFYWMMNKTRHVREYLPVEEYRASILSGTMPRYSVSIVALILSAFVLILELM